MIIIILITFTILALLLILNYRNQTELFENIDCQRSDNAGKKVCLEQNKINDTINEFKEADFSSLANHYYPYNEIYNKYIQKLDSKIANLTADTQSKVSKYGTELTIMEDKYEDLRRNINPTFNSNFDSNIVQLYKYDNDGDDNLKYLTLKNNKVDGKQTFQIYMNSDGTECLKQNDNGDYSVEKCVTVEDDIADSKQLFNIKYVLDGADYENVVKNPDFRHPEKAGSLEYPVLLITGNNNNCVNLHKNSVSMEPCKYKKTQMFKLPKL